MSAYMVDDAHIDALVTAGLVLPRPYGPMRWYIGEPGDTVSQSGEPWGPGLADYVRECGRELTDETAESVGAMLVAENRRSIDFRYAEDELEPIYQFHRLAGTPTAIRTLAALGCYEYQACEHPDWKKSEAFAFCEALRHCAISRLPGIDEYRGEIQNRNVFLSDGLVAR